MSLRSPVMLTKTPQKKTFQEITKIFMKKILDMVNQNVQDALEKFQDTKIKEHKKTQKQINTSTSTKEEQRAL
jgi:hypothetical protein